LDYTTVILSSATLPFSTLIDPLPKPVLCIPRVVASDTEPSFGPSIISKILAVTKHPRLVLTISTSLLVRIRILSWWVVGTQPSLPAPIASPSRIYRYRKFRGFASVGLLESKAWLRSSTRSVPSHCYHWLLPSWTSRITLQ
jgi:hypothetical protein